MLCRCTTLVGIGLLSCATLLGQSAPGTRVRPARPAAAKKHAAAPHPAAQNASIPPLTPEEMPAAAPQVAFQNGQLSVQADNATLASVLTAISRATGAQIELPPGAGRERVVSSLGPGLAAVVMSSLLRGSSYNYLIVGSTRYPGAVQRVILAPRGAGAPSGTATAASSPAASPPMQGAMTPGEGSFEAGEQPPDVQPNPAPLSPGAAGQQPGAFGPPTAGPGQNPGQGQILPAGQLPADQTTQPPPPKTPQQLLEELQKLQQQRNQQQP